jgi:hypothetical protein
MTPSNKLKWPVSPNMPRACQRALLLGTLAVSLTLSGCAVIAIADTAASAVIGVGGLVVDAAVGTVRIGGKVVGAGADLVLGSGSEK